MFICYLHDSHKVAVGIHDNQNTQYVVLWGAIAMEPSKSAGSAQVLKLPFEQLPNLPKPIVPDLNLNIDNINLAPSLGYAIKVIVRCSRDVFKTVYWGQRGE